MEYLLGRNIYFTEFFNKVNQAIIESVDYVVEHRQNDTTTSEPSGIIKIGKDSSIKIIR